jgi:NDP-sugar pyrophosphorylase family protein
MNVIIPIGGTGERFKEDGYNSPKPLIKVLGKHMLQHVLDCLNLKQEDNVIIVYNKTLKDYSFKERLNIKTNSMFIELPTQTKGAAETVLYGLQNIPTHLMKNNTIVLDCDNF